MRYKVTKILNDVACSNIILKHYKEIKPAFIGHEKIYNTKIRQSSIKLLSEDEKNLLVNDPNRELSIEVQFAEYNIGGFYDWHDDLWNGGFEEITTVILLNDEFEGGEFQIKTSDNQIETCVMRIGESIQFPSEVIHRVKPVTKGVRYSLAIWNSILRFPVAGII